MPSRSLRLFVSGPRRGYVPVHLRRACLATISVVLWGGLLEGCHATDSLGPASRKRIATRITAVTKREQQGTAGLPLEQPVAVRIIDADSEPVSGVRVSFTVTAGGGSLSSSTDTSDAAGEARVVWTLGPVTGADSMTVLASGLIDSLVTFSATGAAGTAAQLAFLAQPSTTAATHAMTPAVQIAVQDANGNTVTTSTAPVALALAGDTATHVASVSAKSGIATFSDVRIDRAAAGLTLTAMSAGLSRATSDTFDIVPADAAQLVILVEPSATAASGQALTRQPVIQIVDAGGNHVGHAGVTVTASLTSGGGHLDGTRAAVTDSNGAATFTDLSISGSIGPRTLTFFAPSLTAVASDTIVLGAGAAASLAIHDGDGQTATVGSAVPIAPSVIVRDASGNAVPGVPVTFTVASGGGTLTPAASVTTGADGIASVESWTLGTAAGTNTLRVTSPLVADGAVRFSATGTPGAPSATHSTISASPTSLTAGSDKSVVSVTLKDAFDNPIPGDAVVLSATGTGNIVVQPTGVTDAAGRIAGAFSSNDAGTKVVSAAVKNGVALQATATISVHEAVVASVVVTPSSSSLLVGQSTTLAAEPRDANGKPVAGQNVAWTSSSPSVASVSSTGVVAAVAPGTATITATSSGRTGSARITVSYNGGTLQGLTYCTAGSVKLLMDVSIPDASKPRPLPVAIHMHGGGWRSGTRTSDYHLDEITQRLVDRGIVVVTVDYRLAPTYMWPAQIEDVKCAVRHLRANAARYGIDPSRMGAWGGSAGGHLAAMLGTVDATSSFDVSSIYAGGGYAGYSSKVQATVTQSGITDLTHPSDFTDDFSNVFHTWPDSTSSELIQASPITHVSPDDGPFLILHGTDDTLVAPPQAQRFADRLRAAGVSETLLYVQHADHDFSPTDAPIDPDAETIVNMIVDFFSQHLQAGVP